MCVHPTFFDFDDVGMIETGHEIDLAPNAGQIVRIFDARLLDCLDRHLLILTLVDGQFHLAVRALAQRLLEVKPAVQGFTLRLMSVHVAAAAAARVLLRRGWRGGRLTETVQTAQAGPVLIARARTGVSIGSARLQPSKTRERERVRDRRAVI